MTPLCNWWLCSFFMISTDVWLTVRLFDLSYHYFYGFYDHQAHMERGNCFFNIRFCLLDFYVH